MTSLSLRPERTALLLLDMQREIIGPSALTPDEPEPRARIEAAVDRAAVALGVAREAGVRVVHVRVAFGPDRPEGNPHAALFRFIAERDALRDGTPGAAFDPRVAPAEGERVITKHGVSAFVGTTLEARLHEARVDTVVLCGLATHYAVEGTARHASDLGLRFVVLRDACASATAARHEMALVNLAPLGEIADVDAFCAAIRLLHARET